MKRSIFVVVSAVVLVGLGLYFSGCEQYEPPLIGTGAGDYVYVESTNGNEGAISVMLVAGQNIDAGTVDLSIEGDYLCVTYNPANGWAINSTHLWISSTTSANPPMNKAGNPIPGHFPFSPGSADGYKQCVPLTRWNTGDPTVDISDSTDEECYKRIAIAAYAEVTNGAQTEGAWGDGARINARGNWAMKFTVDLRCAANAAAGEQVTRVVNCDDGWAKAQEGSHCFSDPEINGLLEHPNQAWGWTNGPFSVGTHTFDLYLGAGQCNAGSGHVRGTVTVNYDGTNANVTFEAIPPYVLSNTQLYIGADTLYWDGSYFEDCRCIGATANNATQCANRGGMWVCTERKDYSRNFAQFPLHHENLSADYGSYTLVDSYLDIPVADGFWVMAHAEACSLYFETLP